MTIDRMLRRGVFPILSERPLDESVPANAATGKVYVVEVGAYSDRYIDAIFTTRELAEAFIVDRQRRAFEREGRKAERRATGWALATPTDGTVWLISYTDPPTATVDGVPVEMVATGHEDIPAETFEEFVARHTWNEFGDVEEYDIWDMLPVVPEAPDTD